MADRTRSPITGNTEDVRRCVEWFKNVDRQLKWLAGDMQNQMDAETLCSQSHDLTLHSVRQRAEDVAGLLGDEQKLACVTENVHARILPPLRALRECCHILTGECGVWIESSEASTSWGASVDGFIAANSWFRREAEDLFKVLVISLADEPMSQAQSGTAWHDAAEHPPKEFHGPLAGSKKKLAEWILPASDAKGSRDRQLDGWLARESQNRRAWGRKAGRKQWEVWFADQRKYADCNKKRLEDTQPK